MSILLDALRKSEREERLGAVPDIHGSDFQAERGRPRWFWPAVAVLALALVLLAGWLGWRTWTRYEVPVAPPELTRSVSSTAPAEPATTAAPTGTAPQSASAPPSNTVRLDRQPRSPVESLSGERPYQAASRPATSGAAGPATAADSSAGRQAANPAAGDPAAGMAREVAALESAVLDGQPPSRATPRNETGARQATGSDPAASTTGTPARTSSDAPTRAAPAPGSAANTTDDTGLVSYWQLPQERRADLPAFKINVMVWDEVPESRFIIMGGKRYREGEQITPRLLLQEVRRDRVVFQSGPYRFYVTR